MNRRDFLNRTAMGVTVAATGALAAAAIEEREPPYRPCGRLEYGIPGFYDVDHVTLNGTRVEHVRALNDVEGWIERYCPIGDRDAVGRIRMYYETGVVRVYWRQS